jgi:uncharacterized hydrophobic protein (TIGR00271 family)
MYSFWLNKLNKIINIESDTNKLTSIEQIKEGEYLRGSNVFYLFCSALIASVGLDTGSPAVIIGAMLISPLMSPILGIGLSLGTHDKENFLVSIREFGFSVLLSLLVSVIYFTLTPLGNPTTEIISRIKPTALDLLIAFFGGIAGIIAVTRSKIASALPGVAIATALMPPICTAGFGLATARFDYFLGAIYLFFINAVFISFSSYLIVRYLKFPFKEYPDKKRLFRTRLIIITFVIVVAIPSFFIFYSVIKDVRLNKSLEGFITKEIQNDSTKILEWKYLQQNINENILSLYMVGAKISEDKIDTLNKLLLKYGIEDTKINIVQISDDKGIEYAKGELKTDFLEKLKLFQKTESKRDIESMEKISVIDSVKLNTISKDIKLFYPDIDDIGFSQNYYSSTLKNDSIKIKKIPIFTVTWKKSTSSVKIKSKQETIYSYLKSKTSTDTIRIVNLK